MRRRPLTWTLTGLVVLGLLAGGAYFVYLRHGPGGRPGGGLAPGSTPGEAPGEPLSLVVGLGRAGGPALVGEEQPAGASLFVSVDLRSPRAVQGGESDLVVGTKEAPWWTGVEIRSGGAPIDARAIGGGEPVWEAASGGVAVVFEVPPESLKEGLNTLVASIEVFGERFESAPLPVVVVPGERLRVVDRRIAAHYAVEAGNPLEALELLGGLEIPRDDVLAHRTRARALARLGRLQEAVRAYDRALLAYRLAHPEPEAEWPSALRAELAKVERAIDAERAGKETKDGGTR